MSTSTEHTARSSGRAILGPLWIVVAAIVGLMVGAVAMFAWQRPRATRLQHTASYASRALPAARLEATLASAVIQAQDGHYELARQGASSFFTGLQRHLAPVITGEGANATRQMLARRDPTITALARNDPASSSVLAETLTQFREITRRAGLDSVVAPVPTSR
jgi:hypothetical protein